jgi:hypothetical protein
VRHEPAQYSDEPTVEAGWQEYQDALAQAGMCVYCHQPIEAARDYRRVLGWVNGRSGDGFVRDESLEEWAHRWCIQRHKSVGDGQASLDV